MTKENIIEIIERAFERELHWEEKATDELFELIEQEKKEQAREMLVKIMELFPTDKNFTAISMATIKALAKEYEVEL